MSALETYKSMYQRKAQVVTDFQKVIDDTNEGLEVKEIRYLVMEVPEKSDDYVMEFVRIEGWYGDYCYINVIHNSNSAIVNEIGRQLWGEGATGKQSVEAARELEVYLEGGELHEVE